MRCRNHILVFNNAICVIPMAYQVHSFWVCINPAIPHYFMCKKAIFRDSHGINLATSAVIFFSSVMRVCIRKNNVYSSRTYSFTCSWALCPKLIPPNDVFNCVGILVAIITTSILIIIQGTSSIFMERWCKIIPIFS